MASSSHFHNYIDHKHLYVHENTTSGAKLEIFQRYAQFSKSTLHRLQNRFSFLQQSIERYRDTLCIKRKNSLICFKRLFPVLRKTNLYLANTSNTLSRPPAKVPWVSSFTVIAFKRLVLTRNLEPYSHFL